MSILQTLRRDKRVIRLKASIEKGIFFVDVKKYREEIRTLHAGRKVRTLKAKIVVRNFSNKFMDAALQNSAYRSRIVEIKMIMLDRKHELEEYLEALKKDLKVRYSEDLAETYRTINERDNAVAVVLSDAMSIIRNVDNACKYADLVIEDIDQSGWTMKHLMSAVELQVGKKSSSL